ncbi:unnamed protein product, partial [marine sediment metagenome]
KMWSDMMHKIGFVIGDKMVKPMQKHLMPMVNKLVS